MTASSGAISETKRPGTDSARTRGMKPSALPDGTW
jgi:hypothetical protein